MPTCQECGKKLNKKQIIYKCKFCSRQCANKAFCGSNNPMYKNARKQFICNQCNKKFIEYPSNHPKYCSVKCKNESLIKNKEFNCKYCGNKFISKKMEPKYCSKECFKLGISKNLLGRKAWNKGKQNKQILGEKHWNWKGGKSYAGMYEVVYDKENNKQIYKHRYVMEKYLGRKLGADEHVHHINMNTHDNEIENLKVLNSSEHTRLHRDLEVLWLLCTRTLLLA